MQKALIDKNLMIRWEGYSIEIARISSAIETVSKHRWMQNPVIEHY